MFKIKQIHSIGHDETQGLQVAHYQLVDVRVNALRRDAPGKRNQVLVKCNFVLEEIVRLHQLGHWPMSRVVLGNH